MLINKTSLSQTVDAVAAALVEGRALKARERRQTARWIAARQGLPGAYGNSFAGFPAERAKGIVLFTGERITSASARHVLGEEAARVLRQLDVADDVGVVRALELADTGLMGCLQRAADDPRHTNPGLFCCGTCSVGLWRHLLAGGLDRREERLRRGAAHLRGLRAEQRWRRFPFWYTVLALSEMDSAEARAELAFVAPVLERAASRAVPAARYGRRRHALAIRALGTL